MQWGRGEQGPQGVPEPERYNWVTQRGRTPALNSTPAFKFLLELPHSHSRESQGQAAGSWDPALSSRPSEAGLGEGQAPHFPASWAAYLAPPEPPCTPSQQMVLRPAGDLPPFIQASRPPPCWCCSGATAQPSGGRLLTGPRFLRLRSGVWVDLNRSSQGLGTPVRTPGAPRANQSPGHPGF